MKNCICQKLATTVNNGTTIDGRDVNEYIKDKMADFDAHATTWNLTESVQELAPARCKDGDKVNDVYCDVSCHAIGHVNGNCSHDASSCHCSAETVTSRQWATCLNSDVCTAFCASKNNTRGECVGESGWDCHCLIIGASGEPG
jgi:hypothetical protein